MLEPAYISTVDSGNLAGHLIALRQACLAIPDDPVFDGRTWQALDTALALAGERLRELASPGPNGAPPRRGFVAAAEEKLQAAGAALAAAVARGTPAALTETIAPALRQARDAVAAAAPTPGAAESATEWLDWSLRLIGQHAPALDGLEVPPLVGRDGRSLTRSETWRRLAARSDAAAQLVARLQAVADRAYAYALEMDFSFLYDESRALFSIGYQPSAHALDRSYYDLLASEARLASFVAVAKNDVPVDHWFRLGRGLTHAAGETALVSWSGSMFEYLMPVLVMQSFRFTVLDQTHHAAVRRHIAYGAERGVPWGASESAYNLRDASQTYQYRAFGVPDLALKRGLGRDLVIAPYASALAAMIEPERALANLATLETKGALGPYGFRDALDYTRPAPGQRYAVVQTYMAHHVGMGLVALTNALTAQRLAAPLPRRPDGPLRRAPAARAHPPPPRAPGAAGGPRRRGAARPRAGTPGGARAGPARYAAAADRPARPPAVHGHGEPLRRRLQPLRRGSRSPAGGPTGPSTGPASSATCRTWRPGGCGRPRTSRSARRPTGIARSSPPIG